MTTGNVTEIEVFVAPYETAVIEVPLSAEQAGFVKVTAAYDTDAPVAGATILLTPEAGPAHARRLDSDSKTSFIAMPEDTYQIAVDAPGTLLIERVRPDGVGFEHVWGTHIQPGWTTVVPFALDSQLCLLLYDQATGEVAITRLAAELNTLEQLWSGTWQTGWASIRAFTSGGDVYLAESRPVSGTFVIDKIRPDGKGVQEIWRTTWSTGWEVIRPFVLDEQWYLFEYKPGSGTVVIDRLGSGYKSVTEMWRGTWTTGWRIEVFYQAGVPHLFEYKPSDGTLAIDRIHAGGSGTTELWRTTTPTHLAAVAHLAGAPYLVRRSPTGHVALGPIPTSAGAPPVTWEMDRVTSSSQWTTFGALLIAYYP